MMKTRERKARQRELNDFLSGRPIWSKKGRAGKAYACREPSKDGEVGGAVLPCPLSHCSRLDRQFSDQLQRAVWSESRLRVLCLLPPTLLSAAIPSGVWHLASAACDSAQR